MSTYNIYFHGEIRIEKYLPDTHFYLEVCRGLLGRYRCMVLDRCEPSAQILRGLIISSIMVMTLLTTVMDCEHMLTNFSAFFCCVKIICFIVICQS